MEIDSRIKIGDKLKNHPNLLEIIRVSQEICQLQIAGASRWCHHQLNRASLKAMSAYREADKIKNEQQRLSALQKADESHKESMDRIHLEHRKEVDLIIEEYERNLNE